MTIPEFALPLGALARLAQNEEPGLRGSDACSCAKAALPTESKGRQ
jgi:hypothetical protein